MNLQFSEQNIVLPSLLGHYRELPTRRGSAASEWQFVPELRSTFFHITQDGQQRNAGAIEINGTHASQWVLRPEVASNSQPSLQLMWAPATLFFLANGNAPYTLAFGRDHAESAILAIGQVAPGFSDTELSRLEQALPGPLQGHEQSAAAALSEAAAAGQAARTRLALLWAALLLGVGLLSYMAWRLLRQMQHPA